MTFGRNFRENSRGSVALLFAIVLIPMIFAAGAAVDFLRAYRSKVVMQERADAALLSAVAGATAKTSADVVSAAFQGYYDANDGGSSPVLAGSPTFSTADGEMCVTLAATVPTTFMGLFGYQAFPVSAESCVTLAADTSIEIALVVDVSSSMIENDRFAPMQEAVRSFLDVFEADATLKGRTKVSIVPFSSRVSIGLSHAGWLTGYNGSAATPARWTNPESVHTSTSFTKRWWIDGVTPVMQNTKNYYWMGCIEPRVDVEVHSAGGIGAHGLGDATPSTAPFVPMDANPESSTSFCPPPITPLSGDFALLRSAAAALTSQGSTRLDAGMVAGWYTLSPKWKGLWGDAASPQAASQTVKKFVLFMTDGSMNTQYGQSSGKLDWFCLTDTSKSCNTAANAALSTICSSMKSSGIAIYGISYEDEADVTNVKACASDAAHFFVATKESGNADYIGKIYTTIASKIRSDVLRISR